MPDPKAAVKQRTVAAIRVLAESIAEVTRSTLSTHCSTGLSVRKSK